VLSTLASARSSIKYTLNSLGQIPELFVVQCERKIQYVAKFTLSTAGLEWKLSEIGAVKTSLKENPDNKNQIQDMLTVSLKGASTSARHRDPDDSDEDDD